MAVRKRLRYEIFRRDNHTCRYCGAKAPEVKITVDHVLPVVLGGTDTPENLVTACSDCNSGKTSTTPDAPLVADVSEDALRWAVAMARSSEEAMEDSQAQEKTHKAFLKAWKKHGGVQSDLPDNWRGSLGNLIAAGLPLEALTECVNIAFDQKHVYDRNRFKYTCGVAWRKVDGIRNRAKEIVGLQRVPQDAEPKEEGDEFMPATVLEACRELLEDNFDKRQRENYLDHIYANEGSDYPEVSLYYFAVDRALGELREDRELLERTIRRTMGLYKEDVVDRAMEASFAKHREYLGSDFTMASVLCQALDFLTEPQLAAKAFQELPEEDRKKWRKAAKAELGDEADPWRIATLAIRIREEANRANFSDEPSF
jgi:hypothetical protein